MHGTIVELGDKLSDFSIDLAQWSQETFGSDKERGPIGPLKHLAKETKEAQEAWPGVGVHSGEWVKFREEMADCLILVLDASRRGGIKLMQLIKAAQAKMRKNRSREWPKQQASDEPCPSNHRLMIHDVSAAFYEMEYDRMNTEMKHLRDENQLLRELARQHEIDRDSKEYYERLLTEIGKIIGCGHIDDRLPSRFADAMDKAKATSYRAGLRDMKRRVVEFLRSVEPGLSMTINEW